MSNQVEKRPVGGKSVRHIALLGIALLLPGLLVVPFGLLGFFFPLIVFIHIFKFGWKITNRYLLFSVVGALTISIFLGIPELTLLTVITLPAGYLTAASASRGEPPWRAGMKGWLLLCGLFYFFFSGLLFNSELSLFQAIALSLETGIDETLRLYRESGLLSTEKYAVFEHALQQVKTTAPLFLPAIMASVLLIVSWLTVVLGNVLLPRFDCPKPWPEYKYWKLPDMLIWGLIASIIMAFLPQRQLQLAGMNLIIIIGQLYAMQGLANLVFYLRRWEVPKFVRSVIYIMIILQSFGTVVLMIVGVTDVWFDLRRLETTDHLEQ